MRLVLKAVLLLLLLAVAGLVAYALLFDLPPPEREIVIPIETR